MALVALCTVPITVAFASEPTGSTEAATLGLTYSQAARETLAAQGEEVVASAAFFVAPSEAGRTRADESGMIALGYSRAQAAPATGIIQVPVGGLTPIDPALTDGPMMVNVNVGSARLSRAFPSALES